VVRSRVGVRATLLGCCLLIPLGYAGLSATTTAAGVIFYLAFMTLRGLQGPILACVMQEEAPHDDRASVLSLVALLFRLSFVIVGPPVGALIDRLGMDAALALLGMAFTVVSLAAFFPFARAHEQISGRAVHG